MEFKKDKFGRILNKETMTASEVAFISKLVKYPYDDNKGARKNFNYWDGRFFKTVFKFEGRFYIEITSWDKDQKASNKYETLGV